MEQLNNIMEAEQEVAQDVAVEAVNATGSGAGKKVLGAVLLSAGAYGLYRLIERRKAKKAAKKAEAEAAEAACEDGATPKFSLDEQGELVQE